MPIEFKPYSAEPWQSADITIPWIDAANREAFRRENIVRWLLQHWVSEIEPAVAFDRRGNIIGLTVADAPVGTTPSVFWPGGLMTPAA